MEDAVQAGIGGINHTRQVAHSIVAVGGNHVAGLPAVAQAAVGIILIAEHVGVVGVQFVGDLAITIVFPACSLVFAIRQAQQVGGSVISELQDFEVGIG